MSGVAREIKCGRSGFMVVVDENHNDRFDEKDKICRSDDEEWLGSCFENPLASEEVKKCLHGLGVDLFAPLSGGKKISLLCDLADSIDFIRYAGLKKERIGEVVREIAPLAKSAGVKFNERIAARIACEGSADLMEAELIIAERIAASPLRQGIFLFENRIAEARKHASDAGVTFDEKRAKKILRKGYENAYRELREAAESISRQKPEGFDVEEYEASFRPFETTLANMRRAAKGMGKPFDESWAKKLKSKMHENIYEGIANIVIEATHQIEDVYNQHDFYLDKGERGLDYIRSAITAARRAASAGEFKFDEKFFEEIAQDFCNAVYWFEILLTESYATRSGVRFQLEIDFFPRVRKWAHVAGVTYDEDWEDEMRQRASDDD